MPPQQDYQGQRSRLNMQISNGLLCVFKLQGAYTTHTTSVKYTMIVDISKIYIAFYVQNSGSGLGSTSGEFKSGQSL